MLSRWLVRHCRTDQLLTVPLRLGEIPMHRGLEEDQYRELAALSLPLPSARMRMYPQDSRAQMVQEVLAEEGLERNQLKIKGVRELFFSKGERGALCLPRGLDTRSESDERHRGRQKLTLTFDLPRGSYGTLVVKRITHLPS
jgi:tRNA pseudouridine13 synthase